MLGLLGFLRFMVFGEIDGATPVRGRFHAFDGGTAAPPPH